MLASSDEFFFEIPKCRCIQLNTVYHAVPRDTKEQRMRKGMGMLALEQSQESLVLQSNHGNHLKILHKINIHSCCSKKNWLVNLMWIPYWTANGVSAVTIADNAIEIKSIIFGPTRWTNMALKPNKQMKIKFQSQSVSKSFTREFPKIFRPNKTENEQNELVIYSQL